MNSAVVCANKHGYAANLYLRYFLPRFLRVIHKIYSRFREIKKNLKIFIHEMYFYKHLILNVIFFANVVSNLLKAAPHQGFASVKRHLSTKLSTAFVDRFKSAF